MSWWERQWYKMLSGPVAMESTLDVAGTGTFAGAVSAVSYTGANVTSGADPGHTHTAYHPTTAPTMSNWTPTYSAEGTLAYNTITTTRARYAQIGKLVFIHINCTGTTVAGGAGDNEIYIGSLPVTAAAALHVLDCMITEGLTKQGLAFLSSTGQITAKREDLADFSSGTVTIRITGWYEAA